MRPSSTACSEIPAPLHNQELGRPRTPFLTGLTILVQAVLTTCAVILTLEGAPGWLAVFPAGLGVLAMTAQLRSDSPTKARKAMTLAFLLGSMWVPASLFWNQALQFDTYLDSYFATIAWALAIPILAATSRLTRFDRWKPMVLAFALAAGGIGLGTAYMQNQHLPFYAGAAGTAAVLVLWQIWYRLSFVSIQVINTLILLLVGLPLADWLLHPAHRLGSTPDLRKRLYAYEASREDASDFIQWWHYFRRQWGQLEANIYLYDDGTRPMPYRLRPNSQGTVAESRVTINSKGFRGKEIAAPKGDTYRIVAMGGSTTFGVTLEATDRPWPEILETLVQERLQPGRPVEVVNAGVPGYTLGANLHRFKSEILPLQPDMLIIYHGINGFASLDRSLPRLAGYPPPFYEPRPLRFLADVEYRLEYMRYERSVAAAEPAPESEPVDPMTSEYANHYRQAIALAREHGIRLVLATFSMAVNETSEAAAVRFYEVGYRQTPRLILANNLHSSIVRVLCRENPDVTLVDTRPALDGKPANFIDLVHFSSKGEHLIAETICQEIAGLLKRDLASAQDDRDATPHLKRSIGAHGYGKN